MTSAFTLQPVFIQASRAQDYVWANHPAFGKDADVNLGAVTTIDTTTAYTAYEEGILSDKRGPKVECTMLTTVDGGRFLVNMEKDRFIAQYAAPAPL